MDRPTIKDLQASGDLPQYLPKNNGYYLLAVGNDAKTRKGEKQGFLTGVMYMSPADKVARLLDLWEKTGQDIRWRDEYVTGANLARLMRTNLCPMASDGCRAACLDTAGHGGFSPSVPIGRARKTVLWQAYRKGFAALYRADVETLQRRARAGGFKAQVRGNGTSDNRWEKHPAMRAIMTDYPEVDFYDYTKFPLRYRKNLPSNYKLTFSLSEKPGSWSEAQRYLEADRPVAVVFRSKADVLTVLDRGTWRGVPVVDGDEHDARFYDGGVICALAPKGKARNGIGGAFLQSAE